MQSAADPAMLDYEKLDATSARANQILVRVGMVSPLIAYVHVHVHVTRGRVRTR